MGWLLLLVLLQIRTCNDIPGIDPLTDLARRACLSDILRDDVGP